MCRSTTRDGGRETLPRDVLLLQHHRTNPRLRILVLLTLFMALFKPHCTAALDPETIWLEDFSAYAGIGLGGEHTTPEDANVTAWSLSFQSQPSVSADIAVYETLHGHSVVSSQLGTSAIWTSEEIILHCHDGIQIFAFTDVVNNTPTAPGESITAFVTPITENGTALDAMEITPVPGSALYEYAAAEEGVFDTWPRIVISFFFNLPSSVSKTMLRLHSVLVTGMERGFTRDTEVSWTDWGPITWQSWSEWLPEECGLNQTRLRLGVRTRDCVTTELACPLAARACGDEADAGERVFEEQTRTAEDNCCDHVDGMWSDWQPVQALGEWTSWAPSACGTPQTRHRDVLYERNCTSPPPQCSGAACQGNATFINRVSESRSAADNCCVVDGGWADWSSGPWSEWSDFMPPECGVAQRRESIQRRFRSCSNPSPSCGGEDCEGLSLILTTRIANRTAEENCCPVNGSFSDWVSVSDWSSWSVVPSNSTSGNGGNDGNDGNSSPQMMPCNTTITYARTRQQARTCTEPAPSCGGLPCEEDDVRTLTEYREEPVSAAIVDGGWSAPVPITDWTEWSPFTSPSSCVDTLSSNRTRFLFRECNDPAPSCGGLTCDGLAFYQEAEYRNQTHNGTIHGGLGEWTDVSPFSEWSEFLPDGCSVPQSRTRFKLQERACDNPSPACGGSSCAGETVQRVYEYENRTADENCPASCLVNASVSQWQDSAWSEWAPALVETLCDTTQTQLRTKLQTRTCTDGVCGGTTCGNVVLWQTVEEVRVTTLQSQNPVISPWHLSEWSVWYAHDEWKNGQLSSSSSAPTASSTTPSSSTSLSTTSADDDEASTHQSSGAPTITASDFTTTVTALLTASPPGTQAPQPSQPIASSSTTLSSSAIPVTTATSPSPPVSEEANLAFETILSMLSCPADNAQFRIQRHNRTCTFADGACDNGACDDVATAAFSIEWQFPPMVLVPTARDSLHCCGDIGPNATDWEITSIGEWSEWVVDPVLSPDDPSAPCDAPVQIHSARTRMVTRRCNALVEACALITCPGSSEYVDTEHRMTTVSLPQEGWGDWQWSSWSDWEYAAPSGWTIQDTYDSSIYGNLSDADILLRDTCGRQRVRRASRTGLRACFSPSPHCHCVGSQFSIEYRDETLVDATSCTDPSCTLAGGWSEWAPSTEWSAWSSWSPDACNVPQTATRSRSAIRSCTQPPPTCGGTCLGSSVVLSRESRSRSALDNCCGYLVDGECLNVTRCALGEYVAQPPLEEGEPPLCIPCPRGSVGNGFQCQQCEAGTYAPLGSSGSCTHFECPEGFTDHDHHSATPCLPCTRNACVAGSYPLTQCTATTDFVCQACPVGTFGADGLACRQCAPACEDGFYAHTLCDGTNDNLCLRCTPPSTCIFGVRTQCNAHADTICFNSQEEADEYASSGTSSGDDEQLLFGSLPLVWAIVIGVVILLFIATNCYWCGRCCSQRAQKRRAAKNPVRRGMDLEMADMKKHLEKSQDANVSRSGSHIYESLYDSSDRLHHHVEETSMTAHESKKTPTPRHHEHSEHPLRPLRAKSMPFPSYHRDHAREIEPSYRRQDVHEQAYPTANQHVPGYFSPSHPLQASDPYRGIAYSSNHQGYEETPAVVAQPQYNLAHAASRGQYGIVPNRTHTNADPATANTDSKSVVVGEKALPNDANQKKAAGSNGKKLKKKKHKRRWGVRSKPRVHDDSIGDKATPSNAPQHSKLAPPPFVAWEPSSARESQTGSGSGSSTIHSHLRKPHATQQEKELVPHFSPPEHAGVAWNSHHRETGMMQAEMMDVADDYGEPLDKTSTFGSYISASEQYQHQHHPHLHPQLRQSPAVPQRYVPSTLSPTRRYHSQGPEDTFHLATLALGNHPITTPFSKPRHEDHFPQQFHVQKDHPQLIAYRKQLMEKQKSSSRMAARSASSPTPSVTSVIIHAQDAEPTETASDKGIYLNVMEFRNHSRTSSDRSIAAPEQTTGSHQVPSRSAGKGDAENTSHGRFSRQGSEASSRVGGAPNSFKRTVRRKTPSASKRPDADGDEPMRRSLSLSQASDSSSRRQTVFYKDEQLPSAVASLVRNVAHNEEETVADANEDEFALADGDGHHGETGLQFLDGSESENDESESVKDGSNYDSVMRHKSASARGKGAASRDGADTSGSSRILNMFPSFAADYDEESHLLASSVVVSTNPSPKPEQHKGGHSNNPSKGEPDRVQKGNEHQNGRLLGESQQSYASGPGDALRRSLQTNSSSILPSWDGPVENSPQLATPAPLGVHQESDRSLSATSEVTNHGDEHDDDDEDDDIYSTLEHFSPTEQMKSIVKKHPMHLLPRQARAPRDQHPDADPKPEPKPDPDPEPDPEETYVRLPAHLRGDVSPDSVKHHGDGDKSKANMPRIVSEDGVYEELPSGTSTMNMRNTRRQGEQDKVDDDVGIDDGARRFVRVRGDHHQYERVGANTNRNSLDSSGSIHDVLGQSQEADWNSSDYEVISALYPDTTSAESASMRSSVHSSEVSCRISPEKLATSRPAGKGVKDPQRHLKVSQKGARRSGVRPLRGGREDEPAYERISSQQAARHGKQDGEGDYAIASRSRRSSTYARLPVHWRGGSGNVDPLDSDSETSDEGEGFYSIFRAEGVQDLPETSTGFELFNNLSNFNQPKTREPAEGGDDAAEVSSALSNHQQHQQHQHQQQPKRQQQQKTDIPPSVGSLEDGPNAKKALASDNQQWTASFLSKFT